MIKKRRFACLLVFLTLILVIKSVSANFACGAVESPGNSSASWFSVQIYYNDKPENVSSCKVSPEGDKYCCDTNGIKGTWAVGKQINATMKEEGYVASPVRLLISGEGYDIFPDLELRKIIDIEGLNSSIYFNISSIKLNVSTVKEYGNVRYTLKDINSSIISEGNICNDCLDSEFLLGNLTYGWFNLSFTAYGQGGEYTESRVFSVLKYLNMKRKIECEGCKGDNVPSSADNVSITITLNSSAPVTGKLYDLFPNDWTYIGDSEVEPLTDTHDSISWEVQGNYVEKTYTLSPPKVLWNSRYVFRSSFDSYEDKEDQVGLRRINFLSFFDIPQTYSRGGIWRSDVMISPVVEEGRPIVMEINRSLVEFAIYSSNKSIDVLTFVSQNPKFRLNGADNFLIWTSLNNNKVDKVYLRFRINKIKLNASLVEYNEGEKVWNTIDVTKQEEDSKYAYYEGYAKYPGFFAIKS